MIKESLIENFGKGYLRIPAQEAQRRLSRAYGIEIAGAFFGGIVATNLLESRAPLTLTVSVGLLAGASAVKSFFNLAQSHDIEWAIHEGTIDPELLIWEQAQKLELSEDTHELTQASHPIDRIYEAVDTQVQTTDKSLM